MNWIQHHADIQLEARLDENDYKDSLLIELKVPLDLPYQTDWKDFERFDGEVTVDGQHYKYVKRKVQDGMLVVKCIPNEGKHRIESARDQFFQLANDLQNTDAPRKSDIPKHSASKNNTIECEVYPMLLIANIAGRNQKQTMKGDKSFILTHLHNSPEQPPEVYSADYIVLL